MYYYYCCLMISIGKLWSWSNIFYRHLKFEPRFLFSYPIKLFRSTVKGLINSFSKSLCFGDAGQIIVNILLRLSRPAILFKKFSFGLASKLVSVFSPNKPGISSSLQTFPGHYFSAFRWPLCATTSGIRELTGLIREEHGSNNLAVVRGHSLIT